MSFSQPHMHCTSHISSLLCIISGTYVHVHVGLHVCKKYLAIPTLLLISLKCSYYLIVCYKYSYIWLKYCISLSLLNSKCAAKMSNKLLLPHATMATSCSAPQWPQNLYKKVYGRCVGLWVGLNKWLPVLAISMSQLCPISHACF